MEPALCEFGPVPKSVLLYKISLVSRSWNFLCDGETGGEIGSDVYDLMHVVKSKSLTSNSFKLHFK